MSRSARRVWCGSLRLLVFMLLHISHLIPRIISLTGRGHNGDTSRHIAGRQKHHAVRELKLTAWQLCVYVGFRLLGAKQRNV